MVAGCAFGAGSGLSDSPSDRDALGELCSSIDCCAKRILVRGTCRAVCLADSVTLREVILAYKQTDFGEEEF